MKKFLFCLLAICMVMATSVETNAQKIWLYSQYNKTTDTLTNTTAKYLTTASNALNTASPYGGYDIQLNLTNLTGTSATMTVVLQSSLDGVLWSPHFKCPGTNGVFCDTLVTGSIGTSGATYQHIWTITNNGSGMGTLNIANATGYARQNNSGRRLYFRLLITPTGTHTTKAESVLITQN